MSAKSKKPTVIVDPELPFSLDRSLKAPRIQYMCSECKLVYYYGSGKLYMDMLNHVWDKHPLPKKEKKPKTPKPRKEEPQFRKPTSAERLEIRQAIDESHQRRLHVPASTDMSQVSRHGYTRPGPVKYGNRGD